MPSRSASRPTAAAGATVTSSGTNPNHGSVHSCTPAPKTLRGPVNVPRNTSSALVGVKYRINSARVISPNPRSRASSCAENTSRVATYHHHHLPADDRRHDSLLPPERIPSQTCQQIVVFSLETTGWPSRSRRTTSPSSVATTFPTQASPCTTHQGRPAGKCAHRSRSSARCSRSQSRSLGDTVLAASILASRRTNGSNGPAQWAVRANYQLADHDSWTCARPRPQRPSLSSPRSTPGRGIAVRLVSNEPFIGNPRVLGQASNRRVPGQLHQHRRRRALLGRMREPRTPQLMQCVRPAVEPAGVDLEQLRCTAIRKSAAPRRRIDIRTRYRWAGLAVGQEYRPRLAPRQQSRQQPCGAGLPCDQITGSAFAGHHRTPIRRVQIEHVEHQYFLGARRGFIQQMPQNSFPQWGI